MATECDNPAECTAAERSGPESSRCLLWTALALADCFDDLAEAAHRLGIRLSVDASRWSLADLEETLRYLVVGVDAAGAIEPPKALREGRRDGEQTFELNGQAAAVRALAQASLKALVLSRSSLATLGIPWESCDHLCVTTVTQALRRSTSEPFDAAERDEDQPPAEAPVSTLASWMTPYRAVDPTTLPQDLAEAILAVVAVEQPIHPERLAQILLAHGGGHSAKLVRSTLKDLVSTDLDQDRAGFVQQRHQRGASTVRIPNEDPATQRPLCHIPLAELGRAAHGLACTMGPSRAELPDGVAAVFGVFDSAGAARLRIVRMVDHLVKQGVLEDLGESVLPGHRVGSTAASSSGNSRPGEGV